MSESAIETLLEGTPSQWHFRVHRVYNMNVGPEWEIPLRVVDDYHLLYVQGGTGQYVLDGEPVPLSRGTVCFIGPGFRHAGETDPYDRVAIVSVRFGCYDHSGMETVFPEVAACGVGFRPVNPHHFAPLFTRLHSAREHAGTCNALLQLILVDILHALRQKMPRDARVERACELLAASLDRPVSLTQLADAVCLSPKYLLRLFVAHVGVTPAKYQSQLRCHHAVYLLEEVGLSVTETARALGYPDPYSFSHQFTRVMGYAPVRLRRK